MTTSPITRFAPSPTGRLHLGHAWSAMLAHDLAQAAGGRSNLRIEDIDSARCRPEFIDAIYEDLRWLGLDWEVDVMIQSERMDAYSGALDRLNDRGLVYRCLCTRADIASAASASQGPIGMLYPGTCRHRGVADDAPMAWSWRLDTQKAAAIAGPLVWRDALAGTAIATPEQLGDVVLARKDAGTSYHLAVTVDDAAQGITHVVRGRDLFAATHIHRLLQALLALPTPDYHHHPLVVGPDGVRLAKRSAPQTLAAMRDAGVDPEWLMENMRRRRFPVGFALDQA